MSSAKFNDGGDNYIDEVFGGDGFLSKFIGGYQPRPGQIELSKAIHRGIVEGRHVIGEGPTGTGKSLAYSVPAAYHAYTYQKKILIVTANKALQEQISRKDLLELQEAVPWQFSFAVRKGISNYLCVRDFVDERYKEAIGDPNMKMSESEMVEDIAKWADKTKTGDSEDVPGGAAPWAWKYFSTDRDNCAGKKCGYFDECYVAKAKEACNKADIVITNYKLFYMQLGFEAAGNPGRILPPWDVVIMDEAHKAADHARDEFGTDIKFGAVYRCVTSLHITPLAKYRKKGEVIRTAVLSEMHRLWGSLAARARSRQNMLKPGDVDSEQLEGLLGDSAILYRAVSGALGGVTKVKTGAGLQRSNDAKQMLNMADKCDSMIKKLFFFRGMERKGIVYFIEGSGENPKPGEKKSFVTMNSKAIEVGNYLKEHLFSKNSCVIQTSATLAIMGGKTGSFDFIKKEMGMKKMENIIELTVASPFDWPKKSMLVIPNEMPEYKYQDRKWELAILQYFEKSILATKGRTLGLFTSRRMMTMTAEYLRSRNLPYQIYVQYESTVRDLKEKFQNDTSSVLLGTASFAEGFDIRGDACISVIIEKIPFVNKNDPVIYGIERDGGDWWGGYMLPRGIIDFKQRVGRLIRTVNDAGVIIVLDKRIHPGGNKKYRKQFLHSIPPLRISSSIDDIPAFLQSVNLL